MRGLVGVIVPSKGWKREASKGRQEVELRTAKSEAPPGFVSWLAYGTWIRLRKGLLLNEESRRLLFVVVVGRVRVDKVAKGHGI